MRHEYERSVFTDRGSLDEPPPIGDIFSKMTITI
jgi:hypothetical protein